jgi:CubicO group peptidase (beta-lactamase class C family)
VKSFNSPLLFEPGTSWTYGTSLDWVGHLITKLAGTDLESYFQKNIFSPLGIEDITFWPNRNPVLENRLASLSLRDPAGGGKVVPNKGPNMNAGVQEEFGGQGLSASVPSYLKILTSLLKDDGVLLKKDTTAMMFEPQLSPQGQEALQAVYRSQPAAGPCSIGSFPPNIQYNWGLGGLLTMQDVNEGGVDYRKRGCLNWSGMPNLFWVSTHVTYTMWKRLIRYLVPGSRGRSLWSLGRAVNTCWG